MRIKWEIFLLYFTSMIVVLIRNLEIICIPLTHENPKRLGWVPKVKKLSCDAYILENSKWYIDYGISNHTTKDKNIFSSFTPNKGDFISSRDNKCQIIESETIGKRHNLTFELFLLLKFYNIIYFVLSKLCDKGNRVSSNS